MTQQHSFKRIDGRGAVGLVGEPGIGKTTMMRNIMEQLSILGAFTLCRYGCLSFHRHGATSSAILGTYAGGMFDGTDRLSIGIYKEAPVVLRMMRDEVGIKTLLWEGDKLARDRWLEACSSAGYAVNIVNLIAEPGTAQERRQQRGTKQDETWVKGRRTLCDRLAERHDALECDAASDDALTALLKQIVAYSSL